MKKISILILTLFLIGQLVKASDYIDTNIVVKTKSHKLLLCSPAGYDANKSYPLIVGLHYCGSNAQAYRDALRKLSDSLDVVIACPDNSSNEITDDIISMLQITIDSTKALLNINEEEMFLTGMSCNGKVTLKHGLKGTYKFKGIFPWVPWITMADLSMFDMDSKVPVTIVVGSTDPNYTTILNLYDSLKNHQANVNLIIVPNVGHVLNFSSFADDMIRSYYYINDTNKIEISEVAKVEMNDVDTKAISQVIQYDAKLKNMKVSVSSSTSNIKIEDIISDVDAGNGIINLSYKLKGVPGKKANAIIVVEASQAAGAIEQNTYHVVAEKTVDVSYGKTSKGVFPNPARNFINLNGNNETINYLITDLNGRVQLQANHVNDNTPIAISNLSKGMYFISITSNTTTTVYPFVVE